VGNVLPLGERSKRSTYIPDISGAHRSVLISKLPGNLPIDRLADLHFLLRADLAERQTDAIDVAKDARPDRDDGIETDALPARMAQHGDKADSEQQDDRGQSDRARAERSGHRRPPCQRYRLSWWRYRV